MVPGYALRRGTKHPYYICSKAQKQGRRSCPGQSISALQIEPAVVNSLFDLAAGAGREEIRKALPVGRHDPDALDCPAQRQFIEAVIERVTYDHRAGEACLRLRSAMSVDHEEIRIRIPKTLFERLEPQVATSEPKPDPLPRVTKLMALAVRFEGLLEDGVVKNYSDLAQLGEVSRARITQIMNLRTLAPALQEELLLLSSAAIHRIDERALRRIGLELDWRKQKTMFENLQ